MGAGGGRWLRDNAFLVAAVALPGVVVGLFLVSTTVPRRLVEPPRHDLVLSAVAGWDPTAPPIAVSFHVRDGRVEADVGPAPPNGYRQRSVLYLFDHRTEIAREIPLLLPTEVAAGDATRTVVVEALAARRVLAQAESPDGWALRTRHDRGPGLVGELFGMRRHDHGPALEKDGRIVPLRLPLPHTVVGVVGWVDEDGSAAP